MSYSSTWRCGFSICPTRLPRAYPLWICVCFTSRPPEIRHRFRETSKTHRKTSEFNTENHKSPKSYDLSSWTSPLARKTQDKMSRSNDPGHYFQTSDALATSERKAAKARNQRGQPIKLPSKILAAVAAPTGSNSIYVAEAAGQVQRVDLSAARAEKIFIGSAAPLTCLAVGGDGMVYAGSWDKSIYAIEPNTREVKRLQGHTDFVKCLLVAQLASKPVLISGGADATIIVWDISPSDEGSYFGKVLHKLKSPTKALQDLAIDLSTSTPDSLILFSASSDREIRRWKISSSDAAEITSDETPLRPHETSIYRLRWDQSGDGDLWTASADKTAKHLSRAQNFSADTILDHPDFVRDVLPFDDLGLVVTACRDEEVRVWDIASGKLVHKYSGHYEEVTGLVASETGKVVISVSIDGTVRRWGLLKGDMAMYQQEVENERNQEANGNGGVAEMTAEEEAELAELMEDSD